MLNKTCCKLKKPRGRTLPVRTGLPSAKPLATRGTTTMSTQGGDESGSVFVAESSKRKNSARWTAVAKPGPAQKQ